MRVLTLMQAADALELKQVRRAERRRAALRFVRRLERRECERYLHKRGREFVVDVRALESVAEGRVVSLTGIETAIVELGQNQRELRRQLNGHGARLKNLEKWRALTERYIVDCACLEAPSSSQSRSRRAS